MKIIGAAGIGLLIVALATLSGGTSTAERLFSIEDTRSVVWSESWNQFIEHPLAGQMDLVVGIRESSYLSTGARVGLLGLIPMGISFVLITLTMLKIRRVRSLLAEHAVLVDVAIAGMISLWVGAISEGYLLAVLSIHLVLLYMYLAFSGFILDLVEACQTSAAPPHEGSSDERASAYGNWYELTTSA